MDEHSKPLSPAELNYCLFFQIYLIILSVTSLSLFIAPLLWKVALWRYAGRRIHAPYILVKIISILFNKLVQLFPM
jgi:hypothetical protein